ncbi:hypothetical protein EYF80_009408 [Liparis tanakae]|uniref:Uncharacterized protein n=1 Tax=Liparis tanakae TaxID=230148 RepID=A0A4Z2IS96_9TELE|nr:hypothetical protein EYF80_009408 [Liparis tanakae]
MRLDAKKKKRSGEQTDGQSGACELARASKGFTGGGESTRGHIKVSHTPGCTVKEEKGSVASICKRGEKEGSIVSHSASQPYAPKAAPLISQPASSA